MLLLLLLMMVNDDDKVMMFAQGHGSKNLRTSGVIAAEIARAEADLTSARLSGRELRFPKEKRDILLLALSQVTPDSVA